MNRFLLWIIVSYDQKLHFNIFSKLPFLSFNDRHWVVTYSSINFSYCRKKIKHICLHPSILFIHLLCTLSTLELLTLLADALGMTSSPFRERLTKCMCRNNMFPFYSVCTFLVLLWYVTTWRQFRLLTLECTTTVESKRLILVDL